MNVQILRILEKSEILRKRQLILILWIVAQIELQESFVDQGVTPRQATFLVLTQVNKMQFHKWAFLQTIKGNVLAMCYAT